eukprot:3371647-Amphidinium_carterae.1
MQCQATCHPGLNEIEPVLLVVAAGPAKRPIPELRTLVRAVTSFGILGENACLTSKHAVGGVQEPAAGMLVHPIKCGFGADAARGKVQGHLPDGGEMAGKWLVERAKHRASQWGPPHLHHSDQKRQSACDRHLVVRPPVLLGVGPVEALV